MSAGSELFVASAIQPMAHSIHIYSIGFLIFEKTNRQFQKMNKQICQE